MLGAILTVFVVGTFQDAAVGHAFLIGLRYLKFMFFSIAPGDAVA
jgi:hypothetical protein